MLEPQRPVDAAARADGMPLPGRVEVRDLDDAVQIAGPVGIAARLAAPVVFPVHRCRVFSHGHATVWDGLHEPCFLATAVEARERDDVAADLAYQVSQQGGWQPLLSGHIQA